MEEKSYLKTSTEFFFVFFLEIYDMNFFDNSIRVKNLRALRHVKQLAKYRVTPPVTDIFYDPTRTCTDTPPQRKDKRKALKVQALIVGRPVGPSCWCRWQILSPPPYSALADALLTFRWLIMDSLLWRNSSLGDESFH